MHPRQLLTTHGFVDIWLLINDNNDDNKQVPDQPFADILLLLCLLWLSFLLVVLYSVAAVEDDAVKKEDLWSLHQMLLMMQLHFLFHLMMNRTSLISQFIHRFSLNLVALVDSLGLQLEVEEEVKEEVMVMLMD